MQNYNLVLITGGTGDIGTAIAKQLDSTYRQVIALDLIPEKEGHLWMQDLKEQGYKNISFRHMDVTDFDQCQKVIGSIIKDYGSVDALINNAGITRDAVFTKMTKKQW